jgi:hypothetical protein
MLRQLIFKPLSWFCELTWKRSACDASWRSSIRHRDEDSTAVSSLVIVSGTLLGILVYALQMIGKGVKRLFDTFAAIFWEFGTRDDLTLCRCQPFMFACRIDVTLHFQNGESLLSSSRRDIQGLDEITLGPNRSPSRFFQKTEQSDSGKRILGGSNLRSCLPVFGGRALGLMWAKESHA